MFDVLIVGGGAAGMSCALVLGSAYKRPYVENKTIGIITHQKTSHLQNARFNNVLGLTPGTTGASILESGKSQLLQLYPHIHQIELEKVIEIQKVGQMLSNLMVELFIRLTSLPVDVELNGKSVLV